MRMGKRIRVINNEPEPIPALDIETAEFIGAKRITRKVKEGIEVIK